MRSAVLVDAVGRCHGAGRWGGHLCQERGWSPTAHSPRRPAWTRGPLPAVLPAPAAAPPRSRPAPCSGGSTAEQECIRFLLMPARPRGLFPPRVSLQQNVTAKISWPEAGVPQDAFSPCLPQTGQAPITLTRTTLGQGGPSSARGQHDLLPKPSAHEPDTLRVWDQHHCARGPRSA